MKIETKDYNDLSFAIQYFLEGLVEPTSSLSNLSSNSKLKHIFSLQKYRITLDEHFKKANNDWELKSIKKIRHRSWKI